MHETHALERSGACIGPRVRNVLLDFWAVIAQTAPVLALALVIEARAFARQVTRQDDFAASRVQRVIFVVISAIAGLGLLSAFTLSLSTLLYGDPGDLAARLAMWSLTFAFGAVVLNPLVPLLLAMVIDLRAAHVESWMRKQSRRREVQMQDVVEWGERVTRERVIADLSKQAVAYSDVMGFIRVNRRNQDPETLRRIGKANDYLDELDEWRLGFDEHLFKTRAMLSEGREMIRESSSEELRIDMAPFMERLQALID